MVVVDPAAANAAQVKRPSGSINIAFADLDIGTADPNGIATAIHLLRRDEALIDLVGGEMGSEIVGAYPHAPESVVTAVGLVAQVADEDVAMVAGIDRQFLDAEMIRAADHRIERHRYVGPEQAGRVFVFPAQYGEARNRQRRGGLIAPARKQHYA